VKDQRCWKATEPAKTWGHARPFTEAAHRRRPGKTTCTASPRSYPPPAPPRLHQHHACAIHQGLGTTSAPHLSSCPLTSHSARRSLASPGSKLPPLPAAPSSPPRPFAQVIHPNRATPDCTDPIGSRPTRSRRSRPLTPRAPSRSSPSRLPPHLPRSRTLRASSSRTRPSRSMSRALLERTAQLHPRRTGSRRRKRPPHLLLTKRTPAATRLLYQNTSDCVHIERQ
jgi:hypothetical protein